MAFFYAVLENFSDAKKSNFSNAKLVLLLLNEHTNYLKRTNLLYKAKEEIWIFPMGTEILIPTFKRKAGQVGNATEQVDRNYLRDS